MFTSIVSFAKQFIGVYFIEVVHQLLSELLKLNVIMFK